MVCVGSLMNWTSFIPTIFGSLLDFVSYMIRPNGT